MSFQSVGARAMLPFYLILSVALPALLLSIFSSGNASASHCNNTIPAWICHPPTPTAVWYPPATPTPVYIPPTRIYPTPIKVMPTPTPTLIPGSVTANGYPLRKVIGDPLSPVIYGYSNDGWLFRSNDDGRTWTLLVTKPQVSDFVMSPVNPAILFSGQGQDCSDPAAPSAPLYQSVNSGIEFFELPSGRNLRPLLAHGSDAQLLFAADCALPYLTVDGGLTWIEKIGDPGSSLWKDHLMLGMEAAALTGLPSAEGANWDHLYSVGANIAAPGENVVAYSNDSGASWKPISPDDNPRPAAVTALATDARQANRLWVVDGQGVWMTEDFGNNWALTFAGLEQVRTSENGAVTLGLNDIAYQVDERLYLATLTGLYSRGVAESAWTKISGTPFDQMEIYSILLTHSSPTALWLNTESGVFVYQIQ